ncbi:MAG: DNA internalization-related competence protein ComEC/Rec2 [Gemmatimonadota bacterium]
MAARLGLLAALLAGAFTTSAWLGHREADCRLHLPDEAVVEVVGRFVGRPAEGAAPFLVESGLPGGCRGEVRAFLASGMDAPEPGAPVRGTALWRKSRRPDPLRPAGAGYLAFRALERTQEGALPARPVLRFRGAVQERIALLFGARAPVVEALILARREGLATELRDAFAVSGTAHLLAISGFHVGVVAGLLFSLLRLLGAGRRGAALGSAGGCWAYVLSIGAPDAAARAAVMLTLLALGQLRGRPAAPLGAVATALLLMLLVSPGSIAAVGFQLSFAGAAGLILLRPPIADVVRRWSRGRLPPAVESGIDSGVAATLATLPLVVWHFDRASLVGVPATLVLGPLIATAIPGIFVTLLLSWPFPDLASFLGGGIELILTVMLRLVEWTAAIPGAAPWIPRPWLLSAFAGGAGAAFVAAQLQPISVRLRRVLLLAGAAGGLILWPLITAGASGATLDLHILDVGQGDATALRTPRGRWVLIDAGPTSTTFDAGSRIVVPFLRRQGVGRLEVLVLTHPHLDHIGGARAVLDAVETGRVMDPGLATGSVAHLQILERVRDRDVGWWEARAGERFELDGVTFDVLHPDDAQLRGPVEDPNDVSIVLLVRYGAFRALFTGDAPAEVEREILERGSPVGQLQLLKAGHHGSSTSTADDLVEATRPEIAVFSMGHRNRYGHPSPAVVERLERAGSRTFRTDRQGTIRIRARADGSYRIWTGRDGRGGGD